LGARVEAALTAFLRLMSLLWIIGMAGCVIVIPITAYKLFAVLFQRDHPDDK
jgi:uncharacterized membrane protein